jgi:hypothetical protein
MTKIVTTKKLFYKKWLFKIVISCGGISSLHRKGVDYIMNARHSPGRSAWAMTSTDNIIKNRVDLLEIAGKLEAILPLAEYQIRTEGNTSSIFTNSKQLVETIESQLSRFVKEFHKPHNDDQAAFLTSNKNKVLCNELPLDGYRYKIYFKNGEIKKNAMSNFLKWSSNYSNGRIHIPTGTMKILEGTGYPYFYGQYFYAKDDKIASMALMVMGEYLNKTEEFVLKSEVNT